MRCPKCNEIEDKVTDSRLIKDGTAVRRRRQCLTCGNRFTTYEYIERLPLIVVKSDGKRESFDRQKLMMGIQIACNKRPISLERIENLVDEVENSLQNFEEKEIKSNVIGELVMEQLYKLDHVAYVRFASVYRQFKDTRQFLEELQTLLNPESRIT